MKTSGSSQQTECNPVGALQVNNLCIPMFGLAIFLFLDCHSQCVIAV